MLAVLDVCVVGDHWPLGRTAFGRSTILNRAVSRIDPGEEAKMFGIDV